MNNTTKSFPLAVSSLKKKWRSYALSKNQANLIHAYLSNFKNIEPLKLIIESITFIFKKFGSLFASNQHVFALGIILQVWLDFIFLFKMKTCFKKQKIFCIFLSTLPTIFSLSGRIFLLIDVQFLTHFLSLSLIFFNTLHSCNAYIFQRLCGFVGLLQLYFSFTQFFFNFVLIYILFVLDFKHAAYLCFCLLE